MNFQNQGECGISERLANGKKPESDQSSSCLGTSQ